MAAYSIPTGIRAISFDGDGTLWDFEKVMRHSLECVIVGLATLDPPSARLLTVQSLVATRNKVATQLKGKTTNLQEVRLEAFRQSLEEVGRASDLLARRLNEIYLKHRFEDLNLYEDVLPTLQKLKDRYELGLISNGNSCPDTTPLKGIFRFVVFSQDCGFEKPDPRIFMVALEKAGCLSNEMLHIGDSIAACVHGALAAGMPSLWLNRTSVTDPSGLTEIHSLAELMAG
jgi:FMN hydrolase / 5-amino-6-(5-phospho-D-ribitylamino)uracil phosphatase